MFRYHRCYNCGGKFQPYTCQNTIHRQNTLLYTGTSHVILVRRKVVLFLFPLITRSTFKNDIKYHPDTYVHMGIIVMPHGNLRFVTLRQCQV